MVWEPHANFLVFEAWFTEWQMIGVITSHLFNVFPLIMIITRVRFAGGDYPPSGLYIPASDSFFIPIGDKMYPPMINGHQTAI